VSTRRNAGLLLVTAALAAGLAGCGAGSSGGSPVTVVGGVAAPGANGVAAPSEQLGTVVNIAVPASIRNLPLTTASGTTTTLAAYTGRPIVIADFLTLCTDICPMISANTAAMARALNADGETGKVALLEISVDPHRDTAARLHAYQKLYGGAIADWMLLRATPRDTAELWKFFHVYYQRAKEYQPASIDWLTHKRLTYDVQHSDNLIFLGADGRERFVVDSAPDVQGHLPPARLVQFLDGEGIKSLYHPDVVEDWTVSQGLQVFSWLLGRHVTAPP
jgi:protein SCO1